MSDLARVYKRDLQIAIEALIFRQNMLEQVATQLIEQGKHPSQEHIRVGKENQEAFTNLMAALAKARDKAFFVEPAGVV